MSAYQLEADELLTEAELCTRLRVTRRTTLRWRASGDGPKYIRAGERRVLYRIGDVDKWLDERTFPHRAAEAVQHAAA
jgi:predicted DNA-binding transcriptional regulator AlpA